jgi:hypothetical protein
MALPNPSTTCKNCNNTFEGFYCNHCGQPADTHKMNWHFLLHDIQHGLLHFDKGLLFTIGQLFTRPGHAIREFIEGKRVRHFKPLSLVIVLATVYALLYHYFGIGSLPDVTVKGNFGNGFSPEKINEWIANHFAWTTLLSIPFFSLPTYIVFRKQGYNFIEHLVLNAFLAAQRLCVHIATFPFLYLISGPPQMQVMPKLTILIDFILTVWSYMQFFNKLPKMRVFSLTLLTYVVFALVVISCAGLVILVIKLSS